MAKRLLIALVALIVTWFGIATESSAVEQAPQFSAATYPYNDHHHSAQVTDPATERAPPAAYDHDITYDAVDRTSPGASARPYDAAAPAAYNYDESARFAQSARGGRVPGGHAVSARSSSDALERSDVAAKAVPEVAEGGGRLFVTSGRGVTYDIPKGWTQRMADNGKGLVFQRGGATGNADMIRVMEPTAKYPEGYVRVYNSYGQPVDVFGKPGPASATHISQHYIGQWPGWPQ